MGTHRKISVAFLLSGVGVVLVLLAAAALLAPRLINADGFRRRAFAELERRTGVRMSYERAEVSFFPRLHVAARGVVFEIPDRAKGAAALFRADAALLPLLTGHLRIGSVVIEAPVFSVRLPAHGGRETPFSREDSEKEIASALASAGELAPGASVLIRDGALEFADATGAVLSVRNLQLSATLPPESFTVRVRCASQYWDDLSIDARMKPEGLRGEARLETAGLRLNDLADRLAPGSVPWLGATVLSMDARFDSEGLRSLSGEFSGSSPLFPVQRAGRTLTVRSISARGTVTLGENGVRAELTDLSVADPPLRLSGTLTAENATPRIDASATGRDLSIAPVRAAVLAIAGDFPQVRQVLDIVREGTISRFSVRLGGRSWDDLASADALGFEARLREGTILLPGIDFTLARASGDASMSHGILSGRDISARLGGARCDRGSFRMGVMEDDPSLNVDVRVDTPAGEVPPRLRSILSPENFGTVFGRVRDLGGKASGRLVLKGRISSLDADVAMSSLQLTGRYDGIPFPIAIEEGEGTFSSEDGSVAVSNLGGTVGRSTFSGMAGRAQFSGEPVLSVRSGRGKLDLGELFPWLSGLEAVRDSIQPVHGARGTVVIDNVAIDGPAHDPGKWNFDVSGSAQSVALESSVAPGSVSVARGRFRLRPQGLSLSDFAASLLDAAYQGSAELRWSTRGIERIASSFDARVGPEAERWAWSRFEIPGAIDLRAPFTVQRASVAWEKGWTVQFRGDLELPRGPSVEFSGFAAPGETRMDHVIRDAASDARISVASDNDVLRFRYHGVLTAGTAEKLVRLPDSGSFRVRGDFDLDVRRSRPETSTARGTLEVSGLALPWAAVRPLRIHALSLSAEGSKVHVTSSSLSWDNVPFSATGTAAFDREGVAVDADVTAGDLPLGIVLGASGERPSGKDGALPATGEPFPVHGVVRMAADSVAYRRYVWRPVRAQARLGNGTFRVDVTDATVCGASTLGSVVFGAGEPAVEVSISAARQDVGKASECLLERNLALTGTYDASARLQGQGTGDALLRSLRGPVDVTLSDGRILKWTLLSRIFGFLGVSDLFHGKLPDLEKKGFAYRSIVERGEIRDGKIFLSEATVDAPSMGIAAAGEVDLMGKETDLKVLVAPFTTVDRVVGWIPGLNYILGGTLVSIPVTVTGDIKDPKVKTLSPKAVGEGLLGVLTRTLKLPVKAVDAFEHEATGEEERP